MYYPTPERSDPVPARVRAALQYIYHCHEITNPSEVGVPGRSLVAPEQVVYDRALDVLRLYFACEMDYGDAPPRRSEERGEDGKSPQPAPA
jgi:hypothetical protein